MPSDYHLRHDGNLWQVTPEHGRVRIGHVQRVSPREHPLEKYVAMTASGQTQVTPLRREAVAWLIDQHAKRLQMQSSPAILEE